MQSLSEGWMRVPEESMEKQIYGGINALKPASIGLAHDPGNCFR
jgi:hypothetical protein